MQSPKAGEGGWVFGLTDTIAWDLIVSREGAIQKIGSVWDSDSWWINEYVISF